MGVQGIWLAKQIGCQSKRGESRAWFTGVTLESASQKKKLMDIKKI